MNKFTFVAAMLMAGALGFCAENGGGALFGVLAVACAAAASLMLDDE